MGDGNCWLYEARVIASFKIDTMEIFACNVVFLLSL